MGIRGYIIIITGIELSHFTLPRLSPHHLFFLPHQVSKEVQKLRDYEAALLKAYQSYLKLLVSALGKGLAGVRSAAPKRHAQIAIKCMCQLLVAQPHFNFS